MLHRVWRKARADHPCAVHAATLAGAAALALLFYVRSNGFVARLHQNIANPVTDDKIKCRNPVCATMIVPARRPTLFCWSCDSLIERQRIELSAELDRKLRDEAEFILWCQEHGHPHPHDS